MRIARSDGDDRPPFKTRRSGVRRRPDILAAAPPRPPPPGAEARSPAALDAPARSRSGFHLGRRQVSAALLFRAAFRRRPRLSRHLRRAVAPARRTPDLVGLQPLAGRTIA